MRIIRSAGNSRGELHTMCENSKTDRDNEEGSNDSREDMTRDVYGSNLCINCKNYHARMSSLLYNYSNDVF